MTRLVLRPDRFAAGGDAIARDDDGRVVFVRGAVPGETVEAELIAHKHDWARAATIAVPAPSPDRVVPPCPSRRAGCGGCGWQHLSLDAQRAARVDIVRDALMRIGGVPDPRVEQGGGVAEWGYRTTVRVAADVDGRAGFRAERSHDVVPAPNCLITDPRLAELLPALRLDAGLELTVRISAATGALAARWDGARGQVHGLPADTAVGSSAVLHEDVCGHRLRVSMGSFFQSGPQAAETLVAAVRQAAPELDGARLVVDAYAGIGMLAACATDPDSQVIVIETSRTGVGDAGHNLADRRAVVARGEVGRWRAPRDTVVDVVIADPARTGLGKPGVRALTATGAPVIALVSCDPASLARDTKLLATNGYRHERSWVVDTFPQTTHVEAVSRFVRTAVRRP